MSFMVIQKGENHNYSMVKKLFLVCGYGSNTSHRSARRQKGIEVNKCPKQRWYSAHHPFAAIILRASLKIGP